jgi:AcrR family transcriptional regulator
MDRSRRRKPNSAESSGRPQIIEAAIASIQGVGYYRSSTNEIARRANVSWGALQYHFGTREALLLAIVKEIDRRFLDDAKSTQIEGDTAETRIESLYRFILRHYGSPNFFVRLQIVLNLQHDPDTSGDVKAELAEIAAQAGVPLRRLLREAIGGKPNRARVDGLFHALRGFAISQQLAQAVPIEGSTASSPEAVKGFLRGVALGVSQDPGGR